MHTTEAQSLPNTLLWNNSPISFGLALKRKAEKLTLDTTIKLNIFDYYV